MNDEIKVKARIYRSGENGKPARYDKFEIAGRSTMRVLELLRRIYEETAPDLAFQYSCRVGRCGTCAVRVNGQPALACQERVKKNITIEPLAQFPVVRDLVIDRTAADHLYAALELAPKRQQEHEAKPDWLPVNTARKVAFMGHCISCMICVSACPAVAERPFYGPAFMLQLRRLSDSPQDHGDRLNQAVAGGLSECFGCDMCTQLCPSDLSPANAIREFRRDAMSGKFVGGPKKGGEGAHG